MQRKLVGITGSVGKTSAKEMLAIALQGMGNIYHTKGNCNNHIGLPLTLANMPQKTDYAIMEMGMNHAGEIAHLSHIGQPDLAMITTVEAVHIEHFDSVADIADAKAEIFEGMATGGIAILNRDNPYHDQLKDKAAHLNALSFGAHEDANARLLDYQMNANSSQIISEINGKQLKYTMSALGKHWGLLATAILLMVDQLGEDITLAAQNLSNFSESKGRGQMLQLANNITLIDDSYNASPVSMKAALAKLGALPGRRIAILGEMLELGEDSQAMHEDLLDDIIKANIARVFCCGAGIESLFKCLPSELQGAYANTVDALEEFVLESLESGDMVLVKGSHGSHVYQLVETLTK
jgi:UDP-N-acetylmuramoyl-tripeptide--D-alanyl-D-alanine ligase